MIVCGIHPVLEALRAGHVTGLSLSARARARVREVARAAEASGVRIAWVEPAVLDRLAGGVPHQGAVASVRGGRDYSVADLLTGPGVPLIVVLDGIEDPRNVGAILRTADAAGASGVIRQKRHAAALGPAVARASAGALAHVRVATVVNIARALDELRAAGVWTVGLAAGAPRQYDEVDLTLPTALVLGAEEAGLRRLVREKCDWLVALPMAGRVASLNVSVAAGIVLFEAGRQRRAAGTGY